MLEIKVRQATTVLLESAIHIAPPDLRDWGEAMRSELNHVEGSWNGTMWALGSSSVLAKHALAALVMPGRRKQGLIPDGGLFAKRPSLGKSALVTGAVCVLAALLFFAAAPFRQAFGVALEPLSTLYEMASHDHQRGLKELAKRVEVRHDAEGLAFCAVGMSDPALADEAIRLDPNLIWAYAAIAMQRPWSVDIRPVVEKLEHWDPQNALFHLIRAESIAWANYHQGRRSPQTPEQERAWQSAMAAAFHSPKFDDYLDRVAQLNRRVVARYSYYDPHEVDGRDHIDLPADAYKGCQRYAQSLLDSGAVLEAGGDLKGGREKYWTVVRFGQLIDSQGRTNLEHAAGTTLQSMAYRRLQTSSEKGGNLADAALFAYLAAKFDPVEGEGAASREQSAFGLKVSQRNAAMVKISGLMILMFSGLVVMASLVLLAGSRRAARSAVQRAKPLATFVLLTSAVGLLASSVMLYFTYRPYWYIIQTAILSGNRAQTLDLKEFLSSTWTLPDVSLQTYLALNSLICGCLHSFRYYVWTGAVLLGLISLALLLRGRSRGHPRANSA